MGGAPKALMHLGRKRLIERVIDVLDAVLSDLLVVTNTPDLYAFLGLPMVADVFPDHGSLGGIYSGLKAANGEAAFTVACDMPFLHPEVVRLVVSYAEAADVVIPKVGGQYETMHAVYTKRCLPHMETLLRDQRFKIVGFFDSVRVREIHEADVARFCDPKICFMNVNTAEEFGRATRLLSQLERRVHRT